VAAKRPSKDDYAPSFEARFARTSGRAVTLFLVRQWVKIQIGIINSRNKLHLHDDDIKAAVSAFWFLAEKSNSLLLKILAGISGLLFFAYFAASPNNFHFRFFPHIKNPRWNFWINIALWMLVCMPIFFAVCFAIFEAPVTLLNISGKQA
jgi:hypothetical protein